MIIYNTGRVSMSGMFDSCRCTGGIFEYIAGWSMCIVFLLIGIGALCLGFKYLFDLNSDVIERFAGLLILLIGISVTTVVGYAMMYQCLIACHY